MRLFFAIEIPPDVQATLGRLKPEDESSDYRWSEPALLHVTLVFLGQQPAECLAALQRVGTAAAAASRAGVLTLGQPGSFGSKNAPRVLWIGLDGDIAGLQALQSRVDASLRQAGFDLEAARAFRPHITLARRRESARGGAPSGWPPRIFDGRTEFRMQRLSLFESRLGPRGPTYIRLAEFPLSQP